MTETTKNKSETKITAQPVAPYSKVMTAKGNKYEKWLMFINPFFQLTNKEVVLGGCLLKYYFEIAKDVTDVRKINQLLFSTEYREKIKAELNLRGGYFDVLLNKLRNHGIIDEDNQLTLKIIPNFIKGTKTIGLLIYFMDDDGTAKKKRTA